MYHGVPPFPTGYNNNYQIVQTRDTSRSATRCSPRHASSRSMAVHTSGREFRLWIGDSRGRWEGETLVVETTDLQRQDHLPISGRHESLRVVERFTQKRARRDRLSVHRSRRAMYTRPWTAVLPLAKAEGPIYEYACHEGNYGMANLLRGHRVQERKRPDTN